MLKSLNMDLYLEGFNVSQINCIDLMVAGAAGCYNYENYYFYSFYYAYYLNWFHENKNLQNSIRKVVLNKLGLYEKPNFVNTENLISFIKMCIDQKKPVLLPAKYSALFYDEHYLEDNYNLDHIFLVTDYYMHKPIMKIRDFIHVREAIRPLCSADVFARINLKEDMILEIYEKSNLCFKIENSINFKKVYTIEKTHESHINSYKAIIEDVMEKSFFENSALVEFIDNFNNELLFINVNEIVPRLRRQFYNSISIIFEVLEKMLPIITVCKESKEKFYGFKEKYMELRNFIVTKIVAMIKRKSMIQEDEKNTIVNQINTIDNELSLLLRDLYNKSITEKMYKNIDNIDCKHLDISLTNYALNSKIFADSEYRPASKAINTRIDSPEDSWRSQNSPPPHWLTVDFGRRRNIVKIVVKHFYNNMTCITQDFEIQGSNNGINWVTIVSIVNNNNVETVHNVEVSTYRFIRMYIKRPSKSKMDDIARIYEFEVWGLPEE